MTIEVFRQSQPADVLSVTVESSETGHVSVLLKGELDLESASFMAGVFVTALPDASEVVLDLDEVSFMDSSGVRAVLRCATECTRRGLEFAVTEGSPQVRRLLEITGLTEQLPFDPGSRLHAHRGEPATPPLPSMHLPSRHEPRVRHAH